MCWLIRFLKKVWVVYYLHRTHVLKIIETTRKENEMKVFNELRNLYQEKEQNNLVIFVGAGISENYANVKFQ